MKDLWLYFFYIQYQYIKKVKTVVYRQYDVTILYILCCYKFQISKHLAKIVTEGPSDFLAGFQSRLRTHFEFWQEAHTKTQTNKEAKVR
jgi:hypothetical protein